MTESSFPASLLALALAQQNPDFMAERLRAQAQAAAKAPAAVDPAPAKISRAVAPVRPTLRLKRRTPLRSH